MQRRTSGHSYTTSARATIDRRSNAGFAFYDFENAATKKVAVLIFGIFCTRVFAKGPFRRPSPASSLRSSRAALENASRFLSSALLRVRIPCTGPKKKGLHRWRPNNSMAGDEGCPRAAGAVRAPLRRSAPRVLRWKTLRVSSAPHPVGFESLCDGPKKERPP